MKHADDLRYVLDLALRQISAADTKASALLTIAGVLVAFPAPSILVPKDPQTVPFWASVFAAVAACAFIISVCGALYVLFPRTTNRTDTSSLIYSGNIAGMTLKAYTEAVNLADEKRLRDDLIAQIWINSAIAKTKHGSFKVAVTSLILGILFLSLSYLVLAYHARTTSRPSATAPSRSSTTEPLWR